ncbi:transcriptional regulatory protein DegU [mine drainage metagenome]|uniref:Transcriptional regulatory protein DegU n=1 Tax=mine drainage metagenome TaxID=410659 RepID=A0A1J5R586_9ZZZZ
MHILVADDHNLVRDGLKPFLTELDPNAVILDASNFDDALTQAKAADGLGLVLLDLRMPGMNGLQGVETMRKARPGVPVVILSGHVEREEVLAAVRAGASGYIPKTISGTALINALRLVLAGESYLPPSILMDSTPTDAKPPASPLSTLSAREREILGYLIEGQTNKEIARRLDLQEITIKIHLRNVYRKIGAVNRAQAVRIALSSGWVLTPIT